MKQALFSSSKRYMRMIKMAGRRRINLERGGSDAALDEE